MPFRKRLCKYAAAYVFVASVPFRRRREVSRSNESCVRLRSVVKRRENTLRTLTRAYRFFLATAPCLLATLEAKVNSSVEGRRETFRLEVIDSNLSPQATVHPVSVKLDVPSRRLDEDVNSGVPISDKKQAWPN